MLGRLVSGYWQRRAQPRSGLVDQCDATRAGLRPPGAPAVQARAGGQPLGVFSLSLVTSASVIVAGIDPHRLSFTRSLESTLAIEIQSAAISNKHVLMKSLVASYEAVHQLCANATSLILGQHEQ